MDFNSALSFIFGKEGGFSDDAADRGGATNFGISSKAHPGVDVKNLTKDKAAAIYKQQYWDSIGADSLPDNMKTLAFDTAVQHGPETARQMIEASGGDPSKIVQARAALYKDIVARDPSQAKFANGWNNRLQSVAQTVGSTDAGPSGLEHQVAGWVKQKLGDQFILSKLADEGHGDEIKYALSQGWKPAEIVARFGGAPVEAILSAQKEIGAQSFGTNVAQGAKNAVSDMALGAQQAFTSNPSLTAALQDEARARQFDPRRQALADTAGGAIGSGAVKAAPAVVAGVATGGAGFVPMVAGQVLAGAATGAMTPTTEDGQRTGNVIQDAAIGGSTASVLSLGGKAINSVASKALARDPAVVAERQALANAARREGLPVNAATLTDAGRNLAARMPGNASVNAMRNEADEMIASKIANGVGLRGYAGPIDTNLLNAARPQIKQALDSATNVTVSLPQSLKGELATLIGSTANPLTEGIASTTVARQAAANLAKAIDDGVAVSGKQLQDLASELKAVAQNHAASAAERQTAGQLVGKVSKALTDAMAPDQAAAFRAANKQYSNLKAVEKMVSLSNDTGVVSPRQIIQAVKTGRFKTAFLKDEAPFQELAGTASQLYGPANGRGIGDIIGRAVGTGDSALGAASILAPSTGLPMLGAKKIAEMVAGKLLTSQNPTVLRALTGIDGGVKGIDPTVKAYIARALAGVSGGIAQTS